MATAYNKRPSEFFHLENEIAAWQLDEACLMVGRRVENNLNSGKEAFEGLAVGSGQLAVGSKNGHRSPKHLVKRKVKIKANGTW